MVNHDELEDLKHAAEIAGISVRQFVLPDDHQLILGDLRFHYLDWGAHGPPLVFIHGGGLTAHTYDLVCLSLCARYQCLALDLRGHGDSEWSPTMDYSPKANARDLAAFADALHLDRYVLIGMSVGGMIAYAHDYSRRLAGLVLIDGGPQIRSPGGQRISQFMSEPAELNSVEDFVARAMAFNPRRDPRLLRRSLLRNLRQLPNGLWTWKYDRRHIRSDGNYRPNNQESSQRLWDAIKRIACPTLVIHGAESDVFLAQDAEQLASRLPDGRWVTVESAGHSVHGDNPVGLLAVLEAFLSEMNY